MPTYFMLQYMQLCTLMQEEGLTNESRLHNHVHDKSSIAESLHAHIYRTRLIAQKVTVFLRECHNS